MCLTMQRTRLWVWWSLAIALPLSPWSQRGWVPLLSLNLDTCLSVNRCGATRPGQTTGLRWPRMGNSRPSLSRPWSSPTLAWRSLLKFRNCMNFTIAFPGSDSATRETTRPLLHGLLIRAVIAAVGRQLASSQVHSQNCTTWAFGAYQRILACKWSILLHRNMVTLWLYCDWTSVNSWRTSWFMHFGSWFVIVNQEPRDCECQHN